MRAHSDTIARWIDNSKNKTVRVNFREYQLASVVDRFVFNLSIETN